MKLRRLNIVLSTLAVVLAGYAFYISPDPTVSNCMNKGDGNEILLACTRLIENPNINANDLPMFLVKRARAARKLKDFEMALNDINRALELQPEKRLFWVDRAFIHNAHDDWIAADEDFERALALAPENLFTIMDRAGILTRRGDYTGALRDFERALEIDPNSKRAMSGIIRSNENLEQYGSALEWLAKATEQWPDDPHFPTARGAIHYFISKDYLAALADFEAVERIDLTMLLIA